FGSEANKPARLLVIQQLSDALAQSQLAALSAPDTRAAVAAITNQLTSEVDALQGYAYGQAQVIAEPQGEEAMAQAMTEVPLVDLSGLEQIGALVTDVLPAEAQQLTEALQSAGSQLDTDAILGGSIAANGRVILPQFFDLTPPKGAPDGELPEWVQSYAVPQDSVANVIAASESDALPIQASLAIVPIETVGLPAFGLGHLNSDPDVDGAVRYEPLVVDYYGDYYPSLSLMAAARSLNLGPGDLRVNMGESLQLGRLSIRTDPFMRMNTFFYTTDGDKPAFSVDSFAAVMSGQVKAEKFKNKVVIVGATATGIGTTQVTPISPNMAPALTVAHTVSSILQEDFFIEPSWSVWVMLGGYLVVALYLILLLPRLRAGVAVVVTALMAIAAMGALFYLMTVELSWVRLTLPVALLVLGHILLTTKRYLVTEKSKLKTEAESAESNKMLALQFQGQGQLDLAFEKFQRIPLDDNIMGLLYNLAIDYESKRKPAKARLVYEYMAEHDKGFKDVKDRLERARNMEQTVIMGGGSRGGSAAGTLILDGGSAKPTLGRYDVEKELGKGAMGVVYLGRDPKINREVAIKTMALADEFEGAELEEAKSRFFREAESAGRLAHPNIVTIYDAGEEHDLAYIAMEFLRGKEMTEFTQTENLLDLNIVLELVAKTADALDYAHGHNVIHRDIKPANIMYGPAEADVKITDFGIARISDASRTKTGMVLGTPSYMSPEQLAGKKVDGRSDLFSLGVMMYQLLTGELPFTGDSLATLMYRIANEDHPDILEKRPDLPHCVRDVVNKAMEKDLDARYARGSEFATEARACLSQIQGGA
ncbi:MAG: CHASE2 domain-containing serine/threonine-protein kinase, partial [Gammaproteobacteria bacterium]